LGPEAALTALIGGVCTWIARVIKVDASSRDSMTFIGLVGALGGLFGAAGAVAVPLDDPQREKPRRILLVLPGLAAGFVGWWIFKNLSGSGSYFDLDLQPYTFAVADLAWLFIPLVVAIIISILFMVVTKEAGTLFARVPNRIMQTTISGLALGLLASVSTFALFSGHEDIHTIDVDPSETTKFLLGVALLKVAATAVCIGGGWKGGRFFPIMFIGSAVGLAMSLAVTSVVGTLAIAVGMTAAVAVLLRKPIVAIVFVVLFFPPALYPAIIVSGFVAGALAQQLEARTAFKRFC
jgi:H+/Cl- antiporter ClcA